MAHLSLHGSSSPDLQVVCPSKGTRWSFWGKSMELMRKMDSSPLSRNNNIRSTRLLQTIQAHYSEGFRSEVQQEENLLKRGIILRMDPPTLGFSNQSPYTKLKNGSSCQEAALYDPPVVYGCELFHDMRCATTQNVKILPASLACNTNVVVNTGMASDSAGMNQTSHASFFEVHQMPPVLSLGVCGNALVMRVNSKARCFHQKGLSCERGERNVLHAPAVAKVYHHSVTEICGSSPNVTTEGPVSLLQGTSFETKFRVDKRKGNNKQQKSGKTTTLTRDLFERSSFHLFEVLFCDPFINVRAPPLNCQLPSQASLQELVGITNQAAVGLAGVGFTFLLFVASRMLCVNAAFNKHRIASLTMGVGFLLLSSAMKRVSRVVKCMADDWSKSSASKKHHLISLQKELQCVALNAITLLVMCFIGAG